jgi:putative holliday junction resolvase
MPRGDNKALENIVEIHEMKQKLKPGERLLGLDLGTKTIGIAICDGGLRMAMPSRTIRRTKFTADVAELAAIAKEEMIGALVVGLPLNMDGSEGPRAQSTRSFVRHLKGKLDLPVVLWDERLSSVAAEEAMIEAGIKRRRRAENIDAVAASIILQGALDRLSRLA